MTDSVFNLLSCPYCGSDDWEVAGLVGGRLTESIQAECDVCKGVFEMVVTKRIEYSGYQHLKQKKDE